MQPKIGILLSFPQNYPKLSKYPNIRQKSYISHFHKITISCLRYPWSNLEQVSYDHFTKITISCPNIQISAKNHTLIIFTKLPSAARGTPGAPQNDQFPQNYHQLSKYPNIRQKPYIDHFQKLSSATRGTPGAPQNRYHMIIFPKLTSAVQISKYPQKIMPVKII